MKFWKNRPKLDRNWRNWRNDDAHARRAVVGSEGESVAVAAPRTVDFIPSSKIAKRILSPAKINATSDKIYDATTSGEYIEKNSKIIVLNNEGSTLKVKKS